MTDFETHIKNNREHLDNRLPEEGHRQRFEERLRSRDVACYVSDSPAAIPKKTTLFPIWRWAAAAGIVILVGLGLWQMGPSRAETLQANLYAANPELAEVEVYYSSLVNRKLAELEYSDVDQYQFARQLQKDLDQIEASNEEFRKTILEEGANEYLIDAMIENYKLKLSILKKLSTLIKKSNQRNHKDENRNTPL